MTLSALPPWGSEALAVVATAVVTGWWVWRRLRSTSPGERKRAAPAVWAAAVAAVGCTAYSADTSWRFAADYLDMGSAVERAAMFSAAELALFATALMARQNLNGPKGAPGAPGVLVWVITGVQVIPAYAESGLVGGTVRAFVGPVMAAMLWHLAMGIELRHHTPDAESHGVAAVLGRELRERLLSRLGIAERNRDAAQITRDRATLRAVALAACLAEKTPEQRGAWRGRRMARRLSKEVARASVGTDFGQRRALLDQLAARRHAVSLATMELPSPWDHRSTDPAASALAIQARDQMRAATETVRRAGYPKVLFADVEPVNTWLSRGRSPEQGSSRPLNDGEHAPGDDAAESAENAEKLSTAEARAVIEESWSKGLSIRETAKRATRAPSYVHGVFVRLGEERGPQPSGGQLALVNGSGEPESEASDSVGPDPGDS